MWHAGQTRGLLETLLDLEGGVAPGQEDGQVVGASARPANLRRPSLLAWCSRGPNPQRGSPERKPRNKEPPRASGGLGVALRRMRGCHASPWMANLHPASFAAPTWLLTSVSMSERRLPSAACACWPRARLWQGRQRLARMVRGTRARADILGPQQGVRPKPSFEGRPRKHRAGPPKGRTGDVELRMLLHEAALPRTRDGVHGLEVSEDDLKGVVPRHCWVRGRDRPVPGLAGPRGSDAMEAPWE
jgi:hypothetical protein